MKTKTVKIALEGFGSYLGMEKGCFVVKDRNGMTERYPLFENEIAEVQIKSGNSATESLFRTSSFSLVSSPTTPNLSLRTFEFPNVLSSLLQFVCVL